MNRNKLAKKAHAVAVSKGFWKEDKSDQHCLMLVITEVAELVEAHRNKRRFDSKYKQSISINKFEKYLKGTVEEEFADIAIRLADLAGKAGVDFDKLHPCGYYRAFGKFTFTENAFALCKGLTKEQIGLPKRLQFGLDFLEKWTKSLDIDLDYFIEEKTKYNEMRPEKHGKEY